MQVVKISKWTVNLLSIYTFDNVHPMSIKLPLYEGSFAIEVSELMQRAQRVLNV